jgi:hypothetical protein
MLSSPSQQNTPSAARGPSPDETHAKLYREIGISAVAAALSITGETDRPDGRAEAPQPLPAILRELAAVA